MHAAHLRYLRIAKRFAASGLLSLAGCASVPIMVPDMQMVPPHPVRLDTAHGPLSVEQSAAILARLKRGTPTDIFDRHLAVESAIVGSPLVVGNEVTLLVDGPSTYSSMFDTIRKAKNSINMETFTFEDDEIGQRFSKALIEEQKRGVQVNLIYDSVGSIDTPKTFFQTLKDSGVNVLEFNPIDPLRARKGWQVNRRDHRKLLVVDGRVAYVGGVNISSVYASGSAGRFESTTSKLPWRDTHVRIAGPVVSEFQKLFIGTWQQQKGNPLAARDYFPKLHSEGNEVVRAIGSSPEEPYSEIYATLLSAINSAESQIWLTNAYFVPDPQLLAALEAAARRGVDVRLLLPAKTDSKLVLYASRSYYDELLSAGVKIYEREDALLHAKTAVIDGVWSTVGSTNLDWRSFVSNQEINAVILGKNFGAQMQTLFKADLQASKRLTLQQWRERSIVARLKELAARLWARLL